MQLSHLLQSPTVKTETSIREHVQLWCQIQESVIELLTLQALPTSESGFDPKTRSSGIIRLERALDRPVYRLCGLNEAEVSLVEQRAPEAHV